MQFYMACRDEMMKNLTGLSKIIQPRSCTKHCITATAHNAIIDMSYSSSTKPSVYNNALSLPSNAAILFSYLPVYLLYDYRYVIYSWA